MNIFGVLGWVGFFFLSNIRLSSMYYINNYNNFELILCVRVVILMLIMNLIYILKKIHEKNKVGFIYSLPLHALCICMKFKLNTIFFNYDCHHRHV